MTRFLGPAGQRGFILWREFSVMPRVWHIPFWLNSDDIKVPFVLEWPLQPARIFVRMQRTADL